MRAAWTHIHAFRSPRFSLLGFLQPLPISEKIDSKNRMSDE